MFDTQQVIIKGAGDLATGVAARLWRCGFPVIMTEIERPLTVRRTVSFSEAIYEGVTRVEDLTARRVEGLSEIHSMLDQGILPVVIDPAAEIVQKMNPMVLVDAIIAKKNIGTHIHDAPLTIGLGPGFVAKKDVHAVVETNRGHNLGRVIWEGAAEPNTGVPGKIGGFGARRVVRAPAPGVFQGLRHIGDLVQEGDIVAHIDQTPVPAPITGVLRGLLHDGVTVHKNMKSGDIDPRGIREHCWTISDKALAIGGGVLEAILMTLKQTRS
jgi:xanthine dehydrogenase accessory factor